MTTSYRIIVAGRTSAAARRASTRPIALGAAGRRRSWPSRSRASSSATASRPASCTRSRRPTASSTRSAPGDEAVLDLEASTLTNKRTGKVLSLRPLGDAGPVIAAGGLFAYARKTG
jgi:3-isopropylmalate/(R)-2-methylmalate dehydratase small subunit